jgi:diguanylate cyclase (GGDEF)-like protein
MDQAYEADEATKAILRQNLFDYLEEDFLLLRTHDFRQFHFHLPDSTSFLRMHRPEKYGDSLYDIRYSIRYVNTNYEFVSGFEEGRIFNGYRYVYPLTNDVEHVGSVEISVSMASVIDSLTNIYPSDFNFWMNKDAVEDTVFLDEQDNYQTSSWSEDFLIDIEMMNSIETRNIFSSTELEQVMLTLSKNEINEIENGKDILVNQKIDGIYYSIVFININNIEGAKTAYFSSITVDNRVILNRNQFILNNILISFIYLIFITLMYTSFRRNKRLSLDLMIDRLTNISNRRKFEIELHKIISNPLNDFAIIMLDIDDFKLVNDHYGHNVGDSVLKELSSLISSSLKPEFTFARYGGEEFTIILPNTSKDMALDIAEMLRHHVENNSFKFVSKITISIGIFWTNNHQLSIDKIISCADEAMYEAKSKGKNQVILYESKSDHLK